MSAALFAIAALLLFTSSHANDATLIEVPDKVTDAHKLIALPEGNTK